MTSRRPRQPNPEPERDPESLAPQSEAEPSEEGADPSEEAPTREVEVSIGASATADLEAAGAPVSQTPMEPEIALPDEELTCAVCQSPILAPTPYIRASYGLVHYDGCRHQARPMRR